MAHENWQQVKEIFADALRQKPELRAEFLASACCDDKNLRREVESLLASFDSAESFMESPAVGDIADSFGEVNSLQTGFTFGHYEIIKQIGVGGMGEVYLAADKKLDRQVAVKILNEKFASHESNLNRFVREAKAASSLNHPNILVIHEIGETADQHYIVSEFVEGKTLREMFKEKTLKLKECLDISIQVANALSVAHQAHLIHRDIKPENIMIRPDGYIKILDFGLAKLIKKKKSFIDLEDKTAKQNQTAKGVIMGTVNYMSPEQAKAEKVDERTDIFSFGAMIYEMIAGRTPFQGDSVSETFANLINLEPPPPARFASDVPAELQRVVLKMLRKDKTERFQTMKELSADLKSLRENLSLEEKLERQTLPGDENATAILQATTGDANLQTAETQNSFSRQVKRHKSLAAFALAALLVGAIGLGYYFFNRNKTPLVFQAGKITRLTSTGRVKNAAVSPDGKFVIYAQEENDLKQGLWIKHVGSESGIQIVPPEDTKYYGFTISPDGNYLYYGNDRGSLFQIPVLGGTPRKILDRVFFSPGGGISFSPDGKQITYISFSESRKPALFIADADGTNERILAEFEQPIRVFAPTAWSPDGKVISCWFIKAGIQNILAVQVKDGTSVLILNGNWAVVRSFSWMPDSKGLIVVGRRTEDVQNLLQVWHVSYPSGEARLIVNDNNNYESLSLTSDGRSLAIVRNEQIANVWMILDSASNLRQVTAGFEKIDGVDTLSWLLDGKILYESTVGGMPSIWTTQVDGGNQRQLLKDADLPAVSLDGRYLVYRTVPKNGNFGLWRMDMKDGTQMQLTKGLDIWATFSPDGKWIVYTEYGERVTISRVSVEGGEPKVIYDGSGVCPAVSPDGKTIAFTTQGKINLISFEGGEIIKTFDAKPERVERSDKRNLQWTPDGRGIYFIALNNGVSNIWRQPIDGSPPVQVTKFETGRIFNFAYSPDGKQIALSRGSLNSDVVLIENFK